MPDDTTTTSGAELAEAHSHLVVEHDLLRSRNARIAVLAMESLQDGDVLTLPNTYGEILRALMPHVGERGESEGALDCLRRIIRERDELLEKVNER